MDSQLVFLRTRLSGTLRDDEIVKALLQLKSDEDGSRGEFKHPSIKSEELRKLNETVTPVRDSITAIQPQLRELTPGGLTAMVKELWRRLGKERFSAFLAVIQINDAITDDLVSPFQQELRKCGESPISWMNRVEEPISWMNRGEEPERHR